MLRQTPWMIIAVLMLSACGTATSQGTNLSNGPSDPASNASSSSTQDADSVATAEPTAGIDTEQPGSSVEEERACTQQVQHTYDLRSNEVTIAFQDAESARMDDSAVVEQVLERYAQELEGAPVETTDEPSAPTRNEVARASNLRAVEPTGREDDSEQTWRDPHSEHGYVVLSVLENGIRILEEQYVVPIDRCQR